MNQIVRQIEARARELPDAIAIRAGDRSLTYAQLVEDLRWVADKLRLLQAKSLGIYLDNGIEWIVIDLAASYAGIQVVPLPWFFSAGQIQHAVERGLVDLVAIDRDLPAGLVADGAAITGYGRACLQSIAKATFESQKPHGSGKISFTSGSTGNPKGIELDPAFIDQTCNSICMAIPGDRVGIHLSVLPYATLLENIAGVYAPLVLGKCVHAEAASAVGLLPDLRIDPEQFTRIFNRVRPASMILTPQLLEFLCLLCEHEAIDPGCLGFVAVGGARVGEFLTHRARAAGIPVYEGYGLTEFCSVAMLNTPSDERIGSVGKPLPGVDVELGVDGEIILSTLISNADEGGIRERRITLETGDYGAIDDDGFVYVHGRKSNLIVLANGRNVAPEWIEAELAASPAITQAYVYSADENKLSALLFADGSVGDPDLEAEVKRINLDLPAYAGIHDWRRLQTPFSRENEMLTVNGRLRRNHIRRRLTMLLDRDKEPVHITS